MTEGGAVDRIEQAVFAFQPRSGMRIVASSVSNSQVVNSWKHRLEPFIRLDRFQGLPPPAHALSYFVLNKQQVAVLFRWTDERNLPGRNSSRFLIGHPDALTVSVALGLERWSGWTRYAGESQSLGPLSAEEVVRFGQDAEQALRDRAKQDPVSLQKILAQLIERPGEPLSIIGCSAEQPVALMWALNEVANGYLAQRFRTRREWSFSTYEIYHDDAIAGLPENVFLPGRPSSRGQVTRNVVNLEAHPRAGDEACREAQHLVKRFLEGEPSYEPVSISVPMSKAEPAQVAAGSAGHGDGLPSSAAHYGSSAPPAGEPPTSAAGAPPAQQYPSERRVTEARERPGTRAGPLTRLLNAVDERQLRQELDELRNRAADARQRAELRAALGVQGLDDIIDVTLRLVPADHRADIFALILDVVFGRGLVDLNEQSAQAFADAVVVNSRSERFVDLLRWRVHWRLGSDDQMAGLSAAEEPGDRSTVQRAENSTGWRSAVPTRASRWYLAAAAGAAAVLLALVFVVGRLSAASPPVDSGAPTPALPAPMPQVTTPSTTTAAPQSTTVQSGGVVGTPQLPGPITWKENPTDDQGVFLLLQPIGRDTLYYLASECMETNQRNRTCQAFDTDKPAGEPGPFRAVVVYGPPKVKDDYKDKRINVDSPSGDLPGGMVVQASFG